VSHREKPDNNDSTPFEFTEENYKEIDKILKKFPPNWKRSAIIPLLHLAQKQNNNFLPLSAMRKIAKIT
jgi:NADH dehydrogenase (ubiquinone) flavoprotein 2